MNSSKSIRPLFAPILSLLPVVVFFVFDSFLSYNIALWVSAGLLGSYLLIQSVILKQELPYTSRLLFVLFFIGILLSIIKPRNEIYLNYASIIVELVLVVAFFIFIRLQNFFKIKLIQRTNNEAMESVLMKFNANVNVMQTVMLMLIAHLLVVLCYLLFSPNTSVAMNHAFRYYVLFGFFILYFLYEGIRWYWLKKQVKSEQWLPIVDSTGTVFGKVALSTSLENPIYTHPVIRIAMMYGDMLFLRQQTKLLFPLESQKWDTPFERYLQFGEALETGVDATLRDNGMPEDLPVRFLTRYLFGKTYRLVYLYGCTISDKKELNLLKFSNGKWWTRKQIEENLGKGVFSDYFEKEYEYL
jgi:hypothetical protein